MVDRWATETRYYYLSFSSFYSVLSVFSFDVNSSVDRLFKLSRLSRFSLDCGYQLSIPQSPTDRSVVSLRFSNHAWPSIWILSISTIFYSQSLVFSCPYPFVNSLVIAVHLTVFRRLVCQYGRYCSHLKWHFRLVIELVIEFHDWMRLGKRRGQCGDSVCCSEEVVDNRRST